MQLPPNLDPQAFDEVFRRDAAAWEAAVTEVCAAHSVECGRISSFPDGSNLVAGVDHRWVVKIFPPFHRHQWDSERRVLPRLSGRLPVQTPDSIGEGERDDGWTYLIVSQLAGDLLEARWAEFEPDDKARVLEQIGELMAAVHALPVGDVADLPPDWNQFLAAQVANCRKRHERLNSPQWLIDELDDHLRSRAPQPTPPNRPVILTGEYTPFNLLVTRAGEGWQLSGMFDFGDAMIGPREYDWLGPSLFSCEGNVRLVEAFLRGYHGDDRPLSGVMRRHLMTLACLHRYADFGAQIRIPQWQTRADSIEALARLIWPP